MSFAWNLEHHGRGAGRHPWRAFGRRRREQADPGADLAEGDAHRGPGAARLAEAIASLSSLEALHEACEPKRSLAAELGVEHLAARLAPIVTGDGAAVILAVDDMAASDQAQALLALLRERGYLLADPPMYKVSEALLLALRRDGVRFRQSLPARTDRNELEQLFLRLLRWALEQGASDIHVRLREDRACSDVHFTLAGRQVCPDAFQALDTRLLTDMLALVWMDAQGGNGAVFDPGQEQQASLRRQVGGRSVALRWASMAALHGPAVCLRLLSTPQDSPLPVLEELGYLPEQVAQFNRVMACEGGAILFAGTVGSGKSTSLAALVRSVPATRKIITLEDPVEYLIPNAIQSSLSRSLDQDAHSVFASKLRALKRSAMQDVLLGEIRDRETGQAFMDLASSGVSVYSSVHAAGAEQIPERLASSFIGVPREFLAMPGMLKLLVYQALLPLLCPGCALDSPPNDAARVSLEALRGCETGSMDGLLWRNKAGCAQCTGSRLPEHYGYQGRTVVAELLEPDLLPQAHERMRRGLPLRAPGSGLPAVLHSALRRAYRGRLDLRDIEARFGAFETWRLRLKARRHRAAGVQELLQ